MSSRRQSKNTPRTACTRVNVALNSLYSMQRRWAGNGNFYLACQGAVCAERREMQRATSHTPAQCPIKVPPEYKIQYLQNPPNKETHESWLITVNASCIAAVNLQCSNNCSALHREPHQCLNRVTQFISPSTLCGAADRGWYCPGYVSHQVLHACASVSDSAITQS